MTLAIDNETLLGDFVPNVYISRVMLSYGTQTTTVRGDNPHIDIPTKEQYDANVAMDVPAKPTIDPTGKSPLGGLGTLGAATTAYESIFSGLYGAEKKKTGISTYSNDDPGKNNKPLLVKIDLVVKDVIENKFLSNWFNEEKLKKYIKLTLVQSTDVESTMLLDNIDPSVDFGWYGLTSIPGKTSLQTINLGEIFPSTGEGKTQTTGQTTIIKYDANRFNSYEYTTNDLGQRVYNITFSATFIVEKPNVNHLAYFAVANVDKKFFEDSFEPSISLQDMPDIYKHLTGKKKFELIIKNGKLITDAYYYMDKNNKVWLGDIHFMYKIVDDLGQAKFVSASEYPGFRADQLKNVVGIPMKGKTHAAGLAQVDDEADMILTEVKTTNTTIQDFRQRDVVDKLVIDFSEANELFKTKDITREKFEKQKISDGEAWHTPFWASRDMTNRTNFCFGVDIRNLLMNYSPYSKLWYNLTAEQQHSIITSNFFKDVILIRKRVKDIDNNDVFDENIPVETLARKGYSSPATGMIFKLSIEMDVDSYQYCFFSGYDVKMKDISDGFYQYGIRFTFEDTLKKLITKKINNLQKSLKLAKQLYSISIKPRYYNLISDVFTQTFKDEQTNEYYGIVPDLLVQFNQLYSLITGTESVKKENFIENLMNISAPESGTPDGLEYINNMVEQFLEKVTSVFSSRAITSTSDTSSNTYSPSGVKSSKKDRFLQGEVYFNEIYDANNRNKGYEFLSFVNQGKVQDKLGIKQIFYHHLEERTTQENFKYFKDEEATIPLSLTYKNSGKKFDTNLIDDKYTFLSPSSIRMPEMGTVITLPFAASPNLATPPGGGGGIGAAGGFSPVFAGAALNETLPSSPEVIQYKTLNSFYLEIIKKYLMNEDSGMILDQKQMTNLSKEDKKQKTLLTSVLAAKGATFGTAALPGIPVQEGLVKQLLQNDAATAMQDQPGLEKDEEKIMSSTIIDEPNYNNALFFLSDADDPGTTNDFFTQFKRFLERIKGTDDDLPLNLVDLKGIPNHYKQLILLQKQALSTIDTDLIRDNLDLVSTVPDGGMLEDLAVKQNFFGIFMNYFNLVKVEYLAGFVFDNIRGPFWSKLNTESFSKIKTGKKPVLCRLKYYSNEKLGVRRDSQVELPIYDQYFILCFSEPKPYPDFKGAYDNIKQYTKISKHKKTMQDVSSEFLDSGGPSLGKKAGKKLGQGKQKAGKGVGAGGGNYGF